MLAFLPQWIMDTSRRGTLPTRVFAYILDSSPTAHFAYGHYKNIQLFILLPINSNHAILVVHCITVQMHKRREIQ